MRAKLTALIAATACAGMAYAQSTASKGPPQSDLAGYPGFGHNAENDMRAFAADEAKRQQSIFQCMRKAGFDYVPETGAIVRAAASPIAERRKAPPKSRNQAYREGLAPDRLEQYNLALYGVPDPNSETQLWDPASATGGGCWGEALRSVRGVFDASRALTREYVQARQSVARDSRVAATEAKWATCIRGKGFAFEKLSDARAAIYNGGIVPGQPAIPEGKITELGAASDACLAEAGYQEAEQQARTDAENKFVREHKSTLDRLRYTQ